MILYVIIYNQELELTEMRTPCFVTGRRTNYNKNKKHEPIKIKTSPLLIPVKIKTSPLLIPVKINTSPPLIPVKIKTSPLLKPFKI